MRLRLSERLQLLARSFDLFQPRELLLRVLTRLLPVGKRLTLQQRLARSFGLLKLRLRLRDGLGLRVQRGTRLRVCGFKLWALLVQGVMQTLAVRPKARQFRQPLRAFGFHLAERLAQGIETGAVFDQR